MDRLAAMSAFVSVAEQEGFAPAARRLGLSPPAVTRHVAALEEFLQIQLFERTTRSVKLTDAGARYLNRAKQILADIELADALARDEHAKPFGSFSVSAPQVFGRLEVAPVLSSFLAKYPAVNASLILNDRMMNLVEDGIDAAIRIGVLEDSTLRARAVGATRRVVVGSPKYLSKRKKIRSVADLSEHALIRLTAIHATSAWPFVQDGKAFRVPFRPAFVTNSGEVAIAHAEQGGGLAMVLAYQAANAVRHGTLKVVLQKYEPKPLPIQIVYAATKHPSATVRTFIEWVIATQNWSFVDL